MLVLLAGASGLIGEALIDDLHTAGHRTRQLVRHDPSGADQVQWRPERGELDPAALRDVEAVIGLSGAGVGDKRWTGSYQQVLRDSRLQPTRTLVRALQDAGDDRPRTFVCASAVGYYGDTGDQQVDESAAPGHDFLAQLCVDWEAAAHEATTVGVRVVNVRTGLVLSPSGGLLGRLKPIVELGAGGRLGSGQQFYPWVSLRDEVAAIRFALEHDELSGPVNVTGPAPVRNAEFIERLAHHLHRPALIPTPAFALRLVLGEFADVGVLAGQRAVPAALEAAGFHFQDPTLDDALRFALNR